MADLRGPSPVDAIFWTCGRCGRKIVGNTGYLGATHQEINSDGPITWFVAHDACVPDDGAYSIDCVQVLNKAGLDEWTQHLQGKNWYTRTDWAVFIAKHVNGYAVTEPEPDLCTLRWVDLLPAGPVKLVDLIAFGDLDDYVLGRVDEDAAVGRKDTRTVVLDALRRFLADPEYMPRALVLPRRPTADRQSRREAAS